MIKNSMKQINLLVLKLKTLMNTIIAIKKGREAAKTMVDLHLFSISSILKD